MKTTTIKNEWTETTIRQSKKGWIIEHESRISGSLTNGKWMLSFTMLPESVDMCGMRNDYYTMAEYARMLAVDCGKCLRKPYVVK